jgi:hypothetical protein
MRSEYLPGSLDSAALNTRWPLTLNSIFRPAKILL